MLLQYHTMVENPKAEEEEGEYNESHKPYYGRLLCPSRVQGRKLLICKLCKRALVSMVPCLAVHEVDFHMGSLDLRR